MSAREMSSEEIQGRIQLGEKLMVDLQRDPDPRAPQACIRLQSQINNLEAELARREGRPTPVVIGMDTAALWPSL